MWMDIDISQENGGIRIGARGSRGEQCTPRPLGQGLDVEALMRFGAATRESAARGRAPSMALLEQANALFRGVFGTDLETLRARLSEAAEGPLLLKLSLHDRELQAIPWEALCKPGEALGFWASSPELLPVRGVTSTEPWQPRAVRGALRILAIAPTGDAGIPTLKNALAERIASGEIEWLNPVLGSAASVSNLFERLRREPIPHVLHFLGHGGQEGGIPVLRLADSEDGDQSFVPVELLAQQLKANLKGFLRLIVLEACEGARPFAFASAAEILAKAGADAVVAHLWPVKADVARVFSSELYRVLAGADRSSGDIALAANEARRAILGSFERSAEAFSPVVYLRGPDGALFDFKGRKLSAPLPSVAIKAASSGIDPTLGRLLIRPFSLVLGDRLNDQRLALGVFRDKLHKELIKTSPQISPHLPMSALAQRFALHKGLGKLGAEFQKAFRGGIPAPPFIAALAKRIGPGVHTTLLRHPWLELALAEQQAERSIYVIQPGEESTMVLRREGGEDWEELDSPPAAVDTERDAILFRPYGGYTAEHVFARPLLTEDDYVMGIQEPENTLPRDLANTVLSNLSYRPALLVGLSLHTNHHRLLLQRLYPRGIPRGSVAICDPSDDERSLWEKGSGLPGKGEGIDVVESSLEHLGSLLEDDEVES